MSILKNLSQSSDYQLYQFHWDKKQSLSQSNQAKKIISQVTGISESEISIDYLPSRKPYLKDYPDWHLSFSHSHNLALITISKNPIGIDIEKIIPRKRDLLKFCKRWFHPQEFDFIKSQPQDKQLELFYKIWTAKESLSKAWEKPLLFILKNEIIIEHSEWDISYMKINHRFVVSIAHK